MEFLDSLQSLSERSKQEKLAPEVCGQCLMALLATLIRGGVC